MKAVTVFHHKLTSTHQTKTGTRFITELCLDLIEIHRKLFVRGHAVAYQIYHHLFMCWPQNKKVLFTVSKTEQLFTKLLDTSTLFPEISRGHKTKIYLLCTYLRHLFINNILYLFKNTFSQWQVVIKTCSNLRGKTCACQQNMAG